MVLRDRSHSRVALCLWRNRNTLDGRHFVAETDHAALQWLFSLKTPNAKLTGGSHGNVDAMSRPPFIQERRQLMIEGPKSPDSIVENDVDVAILPEVIVEEVPELIKDPIATVVPMKTLKKNPELTINAEVTSVPVKIIKKDTEVTSVPVKIIKKNTEVTFVGEPGDENGNIAVAADVFTTSLCHVESKLWILDPPYGLNKAKWDKHP